MRKTLAVILALTMVLAMLPVVALNTPADDASEGIWDTYRSANDYDDPEDYVPAAGYEYTDEGFHTIPADYTDTTPFYTIQTKEKVNVKDGIYMELRMDDYSADGASGTADNWICFNIWDSQKIAPGAKGYGQGYLSLVRHKGGNTILSENYTVTNTSALNHQGSNCITPKIDDDGKEIYTLEVVYSSYRYNIYICDVLVSTTVISNHLKTLSSDGEFFVGVTFHSGVTDGTAEATILKFGTSKSTATTPTGSDSKAPEANVLGRAPMADSSTVPEGQPCLLFDGSKTSYNQVPMVGMTLVDMGDGVQKVPPHR